MKAKLLQVSWHERQPIWSIDISPCTGHLLTTSSDRVCRLWSFTIQESLEYNLEWLADLKGHQGTVNVGRFNPQGNIFVDNEKGKSEDLIATGSDGGTIILWERVMNESFVVIDKTEENLQRWRIHQVLRKHLQDVLDLQWSRCGRYLISGSVDNKVIIWDMHNLNATRVMEGHHHFVQGVAIDPLGEYFASQSADKSVRIYQKTRNKNGSIHFPCRKSISKIENISNSPFSLSVTDHLFLDDSHSCMFRRLDWSPDGSFLICPAANSVDSKAQGKPYAATLFARGHWEAPVFQFLGYDKPATRVKACPLLWERTSSTREQNDLVQLPYRVLFAVATLDTVFLYDIDEPFPIGYIKGMHWEPITDLCWSPQGKYLLICSTDGYLSVVYFDSHELGSVFFASHSNMEQDEHFIEAQSSSLVPPKKKNCTDTLCCSTRYITQWVTPRPKRTKTVH